MPEVGYSMVSCYRRCPKQYEFRYVQQIQRRRPPSPRIRGSIIHEMLDALATGGKPADVLTDYKKRFGQLFIEEQEEYGIDFLGDIGRIFDGYRRTYTRDRVEIRWLSSEEFVAVDLAPNLRYTGHIDKRIQTIRDGRRWIMDHKTHKSLPTEEMRFQDYQTVMYYWAYNLTHSEKVDGIVWDYIRTKAPTVPEELKKGGLSQAKNIDTDVETYTAELTRLKLKVEDYEEFLEELAKRAKGRFYKRVFLPAPKQVMVDTVVKEFRETALIMTGIKRYPRTMSPACSWCEFYRLCSAELRGLDHDFVRKAEYEPREEKGEHGEED